MNSMGQCDVNMKEILSILAQEWHSLSEEQKQIYRDESSRDKVNDDIRMGLIPPPNNAF